MKPVFCCNCKFFRSRELFTSECHRHPPMIYLDFEKEREGEVTSTWPTVDDDDWCGDGEDNEKQCMR